MHLIYAKKLLWIGIIYRLPSANQISTVRNYMYLRIDYATITMCECADPCFVGLSMDHNTSHIAYMYQLATHTGIHTYMYMNKQVHRALFRKKGEGKERERTTTSTA